jgi:hypothetical protein
LKEINDDDKIQQLLSGTSKILPISGDIFLLARFYRNEGFGEKGIKNNIIDLLENKYPRYNTIINRLLINNAISSAMRYSKMKNFSKFWITENEIDVIKQYRDIRLQKIIFSIISYCRSENKNVVSHFEMRQILKFSETRMSYINFQKQYLSILNKSQFLVYDEYALKEEGCYRIGLPEIKGEEKISVESYSELHQTGGIWKIFIGDIDYCKECGMEIIKTSNKHKMCKKCSNEAKRRWNYQ